MDTNALRTDLLASLQEIYQLRAFTALDDLLQGEARILIYLASHPGEIVYPSDLSRELRLSRSRITGALTSLRQKGQVQMLHSQEDRRRVQVIVTPEGLQHIGEKLERMNAYFDHMIEGLGQEDTESLIALIRRCVEVMQG